MKTITRTLLSFVICCAFFVFGFAKCEKGSSDPKPGGPDTIPVKTGPQLAFYLTTANQTALFKKQSNLIQFKSETNSYADITVDTTTTYQTVDGFGFTLTDGSAQLIDGLPASMQTTLLTELFGKGENDIGISYLRLSIGASDLSTSVYTYDDMPSGQTDVALDHFDLRKDMSKVIPVMKQILAINPDIKILGSPWTPPLWMKSNENSIGGSLLPQYYSTYAQYFVKYIQGMQAEGITIDAITPQNEPLFGGNNPSMVMSATEQADFIKNYLGPAFQNAGIKTKIIIYDHNADRPDYPITVLNDADARKFVDGSAFHLYAGDISALSTVHDAYPKKNLYFTEQYTPSNGSFAGDFRWHLKNVIIGSMRNWSRNALEWNLASDPNFSIHTQGGCTTCKGGITITSGYTRNVGYYIIAHASKFVIPGSVRVSSNNAGSIYNAAFVRPDGKKVMIAINDSDSRQTFNIAFMGMRATVSLDGGAAGTFVW